ncbi:hypothetical protein [Escherichia phage IMM-001]|nr:hypothetical protein [Escherichia phage IMM-001]
MAFLYLSMVVCFRCDNYAERLSPRLIGIPD